MSRPSLPTRFLAFATFSALIAAPLLSAPSMARADSRCGPKDCKPGTSCCNKGCGICAPPGAACILLFCNWGRPRFITARGVPTVDVFDQVEAAAGYGNFELRSPFGDQAVHAATAGLSLQHYAYEDTAIRLDLGATQLLEDNLFNDAKTGMSASVLLRHTNPLIPSYVSFAPEFAVEHRQGPVMHSSLAPASLGEGSITTAAAGMSFSDNKNAVPALAFVRYVHSFVEDQDVQGFVDLGLGFGTELDFLFWPTNSPNKSGLRIDYRYQHELGGDLRSHELSGGFYYFPKPKWRYGLDVGSTWQDLGDDVSTRILKAGLRANYYWDANY